MENEDFGKLHNLHQFASPGLFLTTLKRFKRFTHLGSKAVSSKRREAGRNPTGSIRLKVRKKLSENARVSEFRVAGIFMAGKGNWKTDFGRFDIAKIVFTPSGFCKSLLDFQVCDPFTNGESSECTAICLPRSLPIYHPGPSKTSVSR